MDQTELYSLLKTLTNKELSELSHFVQNNQNEKGRYRQQVKTLLEILIQIILNPDTVVPEKDKIFNLLFPEQNVSLNQMDRVIYELLHLVKTFLLTNEYLSDKNYYLRQIHYAELLRVRGLENKAMSQINRVLGEVNDIPVKNAFQYDIAFEAAWLRYSISSQNTHWKDDLKISDTLRALEQHYLIYKLQILNHLLILNAISKVNNDQVQQYIHINVNQDLLDSEPYLNIVYSIYKLLIDKSPQREGFERLHNLLKQYESKMDDANLQISYSFLRNYCSILIMAGHTDLYQPYFKITIDVLNKGYLLFLGKIPLGIYFNIANVAMRANNPEWALQFAQEYKQKTMGSDEDTNEVFCLIMTYYHHYKHEYEKALTFIPASSADLQRNLTIKRLEIMIYYDMQSELFPFKLDAFKMYVSRSAKKLLSEETRERHANFINFALQISNTASGEKDRIQKIIARIKAKNHVAEKEWLIQKLENMK